MQGMYFTPSYYIYQLNANYMLEDLENTFKKTKV